MHSCAALWDAVQACSKMYLRNVQFYLFDFVFDSDSGCFDHMSQIEMGNKYILAWYNLFDKPRAVQMDSDGQ